jgi:PilZ domain-containing protein
VRDGSPIQGAGPLVRVWGMNANGKAFFQNVHAQKLSAYGAELVSIEHPLKVNDVVGVQLGEKKARFRIVKVEDSALPQRINIEVEALQGQEAPWKELIPSASVAKEPQGRDKRRYIRHRIHFPIELRDERGGSAHMQTAATDISGRGCYVEMLVPFPLGTQVTVIFWIDTEKVSTSGIVRASDPGVGMGIEFIGLAEAIQERMQRHVEKLDTTKFGPKGGTS